MSAGGFHVLRHVFCVRVEGDVVQVRNEEADIFFCFLNSYYLFKSFIEFNSSKSQQQLQ